MTKGVFSSNLLFWVFSLPMVVVFLFLTIFGSRILINPNEIQVTPCGDVVMFREYPLVDLFGAGYPWVRYNTTVSPLTPETNNGYVCREDNSKGQRYNHDHDRGFGKWNIRHYAKECMKDPAGFAWNTKYTAYLFDVIPLRPINVGVIVSTTNSEWEVCPFRNTK